MKKIVATVLAMVMALALCTTAFAASTANTGDVYDVTDGKLDNVTTLTATYTKAAKIAYDADGDVKTAGNVAYYTIDGKDYVEVEDKDDATYAIVTANGYKYVAEADHVKYTVTATYIAKLEKKCVKLGTEDAGKYYSYKDSEGDVYYFVEDADNGDTVALVGDELVCFDSTAAVDELTMNHDWEVATYEDDGLTVATYKCDCGATAKVVTKAEWLAADKKVIDTFDGEYLVLVSGAAGTTTDTTATSPKTFDAGIAMYVGMALTSVAGSAVVIGKKKEF